MTNIADRMRSVVLTTSGAERFFKEMAKHSKRAKIETAAAKGKTMEMAYLAAAAGDSILTVKELITALQAAKPLKDKAAMKARESLIFELEDLVLQGKGDKPAAEIYTDPLGVKQIAYKHNIL